MTEKLKTQEEGKGLPSLELHDAHIMKYVQHILQKVERVLSSELVQNLQQAQDIMLQQSEYYKEQALGTQQNFERYKRNSVPLPEAREDRLPEKAPILYVDWKKLPENKGKTPLDCLKEVWGEYLEKGLLYQDDLRAKNGGLDPKLLVAALNYCYKNKIKDPELLPPKKSVRISQTAHNLDKKKVNQVRALAY